MPEEDSPYFEYRPSIIGEPSENLAKKLSKGVNSPAHPAFRQRPMRCNGPSMSCLTQSMILSFGSCLL